MNAQTKKTVWPMENAESMLGRLIGSKVWLNFDLYTVTENSLSEDYRECQSFHNPFGVFIPTRVLHGAMNAVASFQSSMELIFGHLDLIIYLNDILESASNERLLLEKIRVVFDLRKENGLKLSPNKCKLVAKKVQFCGRNISAIGVKFYPRQYEAIVNIQAPTNVGALMELVYGSTWMRTAIPSISKLISLLQKLLESKYTINKTRKKNKLLNLPISE